MPQRRRRYAFLPRYVDAFPAWASVDDGKLFQYVVATHVGSGILEKRGRVFDVVDRGGGPERDSSRGSRRPAATLMMNRAAAAAT